MIRRPVQIGRCHRACRHAADRLGQGLGRHVVLQGYRDHHGRVVQDRGERRAVLGAGQEKLAGLAGGRVKADRRLEALTGKPSQVGRWYEGRRILLSRGKVRQLRFLSWFKGFTATSAASAMSIRSPIGAAACVWPRRSWYPAWRAAPPRKP